MKASKGMQAIQDVVTRRQVIAGAPSAKGGVGEREMGSETPQISKLTKKQSLAVRRVQLVKEIELEMKRVSGLSSSANELVYQHGGESVIHPSYYILNRAWNALGEARDALHQLADIGVRAPAKGKV